MDGSIPRNEPGRQAVGSVATGKPPRRKAQAQAASSVTGGAPIMRSHWIHVTPAILAAIFGLALPSAGCNQAHTAPPVVQAAPEPSPTAAGQAPGQLPPI